MCLICNICWNLISTFFFNYQVSEKTSCYSVTEFIRGNVTNMLLIRALQLYISYKKYFQYLKLFLRALLFFALYLLKTHIYIFNYQLKIVITIQMVLLLELWIKILCKQLAAHPFICKATSSLNKTKKSTFTQKRL